MSRSFFAFFPIFLFSLLFTFCFLPFTYLNADTSSVSVTISVFQCSDGADNDGDTLIDYPEDPGCDSLNDDDEYNAPAPYCGDGACNGSESCENCSADCGACGGGGGGGGGYTPSATQTKVVLKGMAYPSSGVTVLKDASVAATTKAGPDANFEVSVSNLSAGVYTFGVWAEDANGEKSITHSFTVSVSSGVTTIISGIFLPPTITTDKSEVKFGDNLDILGFSAPNADVTIMVNSDQEIIKKIQAGSGGNWLYKLDTTELNYGDHFTKSKSALNGDITTFSKIVFFKVGNINKLREAGASAGFLKGDLNNDGKVDLVDFSIGAFWYKRPINAEFGKKEAERLDNDGKVDLVDFSIMAYYWTG